MLPSGHNTNPNYAVPAKTSAAPCLQIMHPAKKDPVVLKEGVQSKKELGWNSF